MALSTENEMRSDTQAQVKALRSTSKVTTIAREAMLVNAFIDGPDYTLEYMCELVAVVLLAQRNGVNNDAT